MTHRKRFIKLFKFFPTIMMAHLEHYVKTGYLLSNIHPDFPELIIYTYGQNTTFEKKWNMFTLNCRGLIINTKTKKIQAMPFSKFFNIDELKENKKLAHLSAPLPTSFKIQEKMDGSLGIGFFYEGEFIVSTRGSFTSDQAQKAKELVEKNGVLTLSNQRYQLEMLKEYSKLLDYGCTFCFEIIYPENRIVVDYGKTKDLRMIACFNTKTGLDNMIFSHDTFNQDTIEEVREVLTSPWAVNKEGVVVVYPNGHRLKIKTEEYVKAHRIIYSMSQRQTLTSWVDGELKSFLDDIPDTYRELIRTNVENIDKSYKTVKRYLDAYYKKVSKIEKKNLYVYFNKHNTPVSVQGYIYAKRSKKDNAKTLKEWMLKNYLVLFEVDYVLKEEWKEVL